MRRAVSVIVGSIAAIALFGCENKAGTETVAETSLDSSDHESMQRQSPQTLRKIDNGEQLSIDDIKRMTKAKISDTVIISQINATKSVFVLSTADIIDLKNVDVSQKVIDYMIQTGSIKR